MFLYLVRRFSLRKHAYSNILNILPPENENFQIKNSDIFHISAQNIDCGYSLEPPRRGSSNEYPQSMFLSRIRKIMYTPVNPSFTYKSGVSGSQNYIGMFSWWTSRISKSCIRDKYRQRRSRSACTFAQTVQECIILLQNEEWLVDWLTDTWIRIKYDLYFLKQSYVLESLSLWIGWWVSAR